MSQNKIYVGNLSYQTSSDDLSQLFSDFGAIEDIKLIVDRETGRSKGFAFVTFSQAAAAQKAIELHDKSVDGRNIKVNLAKDDRDRGRGGNGSNGGRRHY